jgi:hypothetical protein
MVAIKDEMDRVAHSDPGVVLGSRWSSRRSVVVVVVCSALLASVFVWQPGVPVALVVLVGLALVVAWVRSLARRDARALIALWLVFASNRTAALLLPDGLSAWALRVDDLALALALGVVLATGVRRRDLRLPGRAVTVGMGLFALCGASSALLADVRPSTVALGTWLALKLGVCLVLARQFPWSDRHVVLAKRVFLVCVAVVVTVAALQLLHPEAVSAFFGRSARTRVGSPVITGVFRTPFQYSTFMLLAVCLFLSTSPARPARTAIGLVMGGFAMLSLRLKSLIDVVLVVVTRMVTGPSLVIRAWTPVAFLVLGAAGLTLGSDLVEARLSVLFGGEDSSPREKLYSTAVAIAAGGFPLGSGFGTFGSEASRSDYSSVYAEYGLSDVYGFSPSAPVFVTDASWATVLGEAGWIGALGFALALGGLAAHFIRRLRAGGVLAGEHPARAGLLFLPVFVADSVTSPQLFSGFSCLSLAILASMSAAAAGRPGTQPDLRAPAAGSAAGEAGRKVAGVARGEAAHGTA